MRSITLLHSILLALSCCACATVGEDFDFANLDRLVLGETTSSQAIEYLGAPEKSASGTDGAVKTETLTYRYGYGSLGGANSRMMFLEFRGGTLNAYIHCSSFEEDSTNFDPSAVARIQEGVTDQAGAVRVLGKPAGKAHCPTALADFSSRCAGCVEVWKWVYTSGAKGVNTKTVKSKHVTLGFGQNGLVSTIESSVEN